ncbi:mitochondrial amidoxime reducing component 2-like [Lucilia sericata]|uniref:mitochondrial amidoxime reducing component 2-like n=1 Tax=Lucilia sericata TaxID=13632 RepID=UPI0018A81367|nr:mitochondrial amidoxime reducing component 2-like [Lucilia sericata]
MRTNLWYTIIGASLGAIGLTYITYYNNRRKRLLQPPKNAKWQLIGTVEEIAMYPVKSGAALLLQQVQCKVDGLYIDELKDRCLVLCDETGHFIYAGTYPKMLSINTEVRPNNTLVIKAPGMETLNLNLDELKTKQITVKYVKANKCHLVEGEPEHHKWFSKVILNKSVGLKLFLNINNESKYNLDKTMFIPVMVMHNKSVTDLNQRLTTKNHVHHLQFRGNVLINSLNNIKSYAEDNWKWLRFGEENVADNCILRYEAPCLRCILTNIDINTCKRNPSFEPLKTLKEYRLIHDSKEPTLGAYYKVFQEGNFKIKDPVYAIIS